MATESNSQRGQWPRRMSLGSIDFTMQGQPIFREWLKNGFPAEPERKGRVFAEKGVHQYEIFTALNGVLIGMKKDERTISNEPRTFLVVTLDDGQEKFEIECGNLDGRYAINLMQRLCNESFDPRLSVRLSPYRFTPKDSTKEIFGMSVMQGPNTITPRYAKEGDDTFNPPPAEEYRKKGGGKGLDFTNVAEYLLNWLEFYLKPYFPTLVETVPAQPVPAPRNNATEITKDDPRFPAVEQAPPSTNFDDLPF